MSSEPRRPLATPASATWRLLSLARSPCGDIVFVMCIRRRKVENLPVGCQRRLLIRLR